MTKRKTKTPRRRPLSERTLANLLHRWLHFENDGTPAAERLYYELRLHTTAVLDTHPQCVMSRYPDLRRRVIV